MSTKGPWTAQEEYFRDQLTEMAKRPENAECADCSAKAPRWAVFNHGIFVCIKCSGQHRNLGTGISQVRSINLDRWKQHQFDHMVGNVVANAELLYNLPQGVSKPREDDDYGRQKWIQQKYAQRKWARRDDQPPANGNLNYSNAPVTASTPQQPTPVSYQQQVATTPAVVHQTQQVSSGPTPVPMIAPMQVPMVVAQRPVVPAPAPVEDLLDMFGSSPQSPSQPAYQQPQQVYHQPQPMYQQPQQTYQQPQQTCQQQPQAYQQPQTTDVFDDLMSMYDKPSPAAQPAAQQQAAAAPAKKKGFDISDFISTSQQTTQYKPQGFQW